MKAFEEVSVENSLRKRSCENFLKLFYQPFAALTHITCIGLDLKKDRAEFFIIFSAELKNYTTIFIKYRIIFLFIVITITRTFAKAKS